MIFSTGMYVQCCWFCQIGNTGKTFADDCLQDTERLFTIQKRERAHFRFLFASDCPGRTTRTKVRSDNEPDAAKSIMKAKGGHLARLFEFRGIEIISLAFPQNGISG